MPRKVKNEEPINDGTGFDYMEDIPVDEGDQLERSDMPTGKQIRIAGRQAMRRITRKEKANEVLGGKIPKPGTTTHFISDAKFDYFEIIAEAVRIMGGAEEFYGSTWTMNRVNVLEMVEMLDKGVVKKLSILTGTYFKQRESSVYAQLLTALKRRGMRYVAFINHTKIALIKQGNDYIVFEGSANFTANPRLENFIIANNKALYEFHRGWMEEMLNDKTKKDRLEGVG
jgi:hypothetical protein